MQRYRYEIDNVRSHLRSLWAVIGLQLMVILALWIGWMRMPSNITVHIPPDLRSGAVMALHEVPAANVYAFAFYIFQQLNRWPDDGAEDGQGNEEEGDAPVAVENAISDEARVDIATQQGQNDDSDGVLDDGQRDDGQDENQLRPSRAQKEVSGDQAANQ